MGGKSGGAGSKVYDYYGTIAGAISAGPVDELVEIIIDGKTVWPTASAWKSGQSYTTASMVQVKNVVYKCILAHTSSGANTPPNATYWQRYTLTRSGSGNPAIISVEGYGAAYLYWGTSIQTLDTGSEATMSQKGHPAYRRQAFMVLKDFLFGRERTSAPNVEVIVRKKPNQSLITGDSANLSDGQANPIAALADLYTDPVFGAGLQADSVGGPDSTTWQSVAASSYSTASKTDLSPILQQAESLRSITAALLAYCDAWVRFSSAGEIEAGYFPHNATPPTFTAATTIDYHDLIEEVSFTADGWAGTSNQTQVKFTDRERSYKDGSVSAVSGYNLAVTNEARTAKVDRPWITRRQQASDYAAEYQKINGEPKLTGSLVVRAEKAASIKTGDLFLLTHDALSVSIICRCLDKDIAQPPAGRVTIRFESDRASAPVPYQPTATPDEGSAFPANETLSLQQFFQPPPMMFSGTTDATVCALVARTSPVTVGANVWLQKDDLSGFYLLDDLQQFAIYGTLQQTYNPAAYFSTTYRSRTSNVTTITTATAHGFTPGMTVTVSEFAVTSFNGTFIVLSTPTSTTFTYANTGSDVANTYDTDGKASGGSDDTTESLRVTLDGNTNAADLTKMLQTQTEDAINDNAVAVVIFDATNAKTFEVLTLRGMRIASGESFYRLKVRRGRYGTTRRTAATGDRCFIVYRTDLVPLTHELFLSYLTNLSTTKFRLQSVNAESVADLSDSTICPDISYTWNDPYAPSFTFDSVKFNGTEVTNFATHFDIAYRWRIAGTITDASGDLVSARLYARSGTAEVSFWSSNYTPSSQQTFDVDFSFPFKSTWTVYIEGTDKSGRLKRKQLTAGGGSTSVTLEIRSNSDIAAPTFSPAGGGFYRGQFPLTVTLATSTSGAVVQYQIVNIGAASGATWTSLGAQSGTVSVAKNKRVYARANSGGSYSEIIYSDYYEEVDEYYPPGTQAP